jgi:hypothetical protein
MNAPVRKPMTRDEFLAWERCLPVNRYMMLIPLALREGGVERGASQSELVAIGLRHHLP